MKKILIIAMALSALGLVVSGCSGGGDASKDTAGATSGTTGGADTKTEGEGK